VLSTICPCKLSAVRADWLLCFCPFPSQAASSLSSLRNHIYSLSRKVLIGHSHVEGLPVDLLLGGLTSEPATILTDPSRCCFYPMQVVSSLSSLCNHILIQQAC
jgi:hypothetical protein